MRRGPKKGLKARDDDALLKDSNIQSPVGLAYILIAYCEQTTNGWPSYFDEPG